MSLKTVLEDLDHDILVLQRKIDPNRPEETADAFMRVRALSLGRSFLRLLPVAPEPTLPEVDTAYDRARKRLLE